MAVLIEPLDAGQVAAERDAIVGVYRAAFAPPPYGEGEDQVAWFARDQLPQHAWREGFRCCVAREAAGGPILGFAYGYAGKPGQWWRDVMAQALDAETAAWWLPGYFELVELAVMPAAQGRGIGGRLHDALLVGLPHRTALLSTHQSETPALRLYRKRGWVPLLEGFVFPGGDMPFVIMGLDLGRRGPRRRWPSK